MQNIFPEGVLTPLSVCHNSSWCKVCPLEYKNKVENAHEFTLPEKYPEEGIRPIPFLEKGGNFFSVLPYTVNTNDVFKTAYWLKQLAQNYPLPQKHIFCVLCYNHVHHHHRHHWKKGQVMRQVGRSVRAVILTWDSYLPYYGGHWKLLFKGLFQVKAISIRSCRWSLLNVSVSVIFIIPY